MVLGLRNSGNAGIATINPQTGAVTKQFAIESGANNMSVLFAKPVGGATIPSASEATDIILDAESLSLLKNESVRLNATVLP